MILRFQEHDDAFSLRNWIDRVMVENKKHGEDAKIDGKCLVAYKAVISVFFDRYYLPLILRESQRSQYQER